MGLGQICDGVAQSTKLWLPAALSGPQSGLWDENDRAMSPAQPFQAVGYLPSAINMDHINFAALSVPSLVPHILLPVCSSQFSSLSVHLFPAFASVHGSMALQPPQSLFVRQTGFFPPYKSSLSWIALALAGFVLHSLDVSSSYPRG